MAIPYEEEFIDVPHAEEFEQQCEVCEGYFESDEEHSLCPTCERVGRPE